MQESDIKISVVVPMYNMAEYIDECLESVVSQMDEKVEVIVCDDKSTDNSLEIVRKNWGEKVKIVAADTNRGLLGTRIEGLKYVRGGYVLFLDADDKLAEGALAAYFKILKEDNYDIIRGNYYEFSSKKRKKIVRHEDEKIFRNEKRELLYKPALMSPKFNTVWGQIIRKNVIDNAKLRDDVAMGEDIVFNYACYEMAEKIRLTGAAVYEYRKNERSMTHDRSETRAVRNLQDTYKMSEAVTKFYQEMGDEDLVKLAFIMYLRYIDLYILKLIRDTKNMELAREKCREMMTHPLTEEARKVLKKSDIYCKKMRLLLEYILDNNEKSYLRVAKMVARFAK